MEENKVTYEVEEGQSSEIKQNKNYNVYMKHYMKGHYNKNKNKIQNKRNSLNYIKKNNVPDDVAQKYGEYLYNVMKFKELLEATPRELINEILNETDNNSLL